MFPQEHGRLTSRTYSPFHTHWLLYIKTHTLKSNSQVTQHSEKIFGFTYAHTQTSIKPQTLVASGVFFILLLAPMYEHNKAIEAGCYSDFIMFKRGFKQSASLLA